MDYFSIYSKKTKFSIPPSMIYNDIKPTKIYSEKTINNMLDDFKGILINENKKYKKVTGMPTACGCVSSGSAEPTANGCVNDEVVTPTKCIFNNEKIIMNFD